MNSAAGDIKSASETLVGDLKGLGKPDTKAGQEAKDAIDQLSKEVEQDVEEMQSAVDKVSRCDRERSPAATSVAATLSKMGTQIGSAASKLDSADPDGELKQAFRELVRLQEADELELLAHGLLGLGPRLRIRETSTAITVTR